MYPRRRAVVSARSRHAEIPVADRGQVHSPVIRIADVERLVRRAGQEHVGQGRGSAPWVGMRHPRSVNPNGVFQMAGRRPGTRIPNTETIVETCGRVDGEPRWGSGVAGWADDVPRVRCRDPGL